MDKVKIGSFIAELRRENGLTQEQLGEKIGVTNKTVSRWENGSYMPDISRLQALSEIFSVSIGEIIAGEHLTDEKLRECSNEIIVDAVKSEVFTFKERREYWKKKWKREHTAGIAAQIIAILAVFGVICFASVSFRTFAVAALPLVLCILYGYNHNRMMIYVEAKLYD